MSTNLPCFDDHLFSDEEALIRRYHSALSQNDIPIINITDAAKELVQALRKTEPQKNLINAFLAEYQLSDQEGIALMCLAEALLRIPDTATRDALIIDKLAQPSWEKHIKNSPSLFVNASTWALVLTGKILKTDPSKHIQNAWQRLTKKGGMPVIRKVVMEAMKILGSVFVLGETINDAKKRAIKWQEKGYTFSYDMLGEAALTDEDAHLYFEAYKHAILSQVENVSIKLSALYPRYEVLHFDDVHTYLYERLYALCDMAYQNKVSITIDAEEVDRLEVSLSLFARLFHEPKFADWQGLGLAVQAYQKRAVSVLEWLKALTEQIPQKRISVRLVKGAYWDSEIKWAQQNGYQDYPVFTRKNNTDICYLYCAKFLLEHPDHFYPQFATHNVVTLMHILKTAPHQDYEFQRLHGMGEDMYLTAQKLHPSIKCRIYAPVGGHKTLLAYLVRRLLENGANSSFVYQIMDNKIPVEHITKHPLDDCFEIARNPKIPLPQHIYTYRKNAEGVGLFQKTVRDALQKAYQKNPPIKPIKTPPEYNIDALMKTAQNGFKLWSNTAIKDRKACVLACADALEAQLFTLSAMLCQEGYKTWNDCLSEVREAIDFCRYYAHQAETILAHPQILEGYTGERNELHLCPRGIFIAISPWNFPLAIFVGQIMAALICGNSVIAKPAEQTPYIADYVVGLFHRVGIPESTLQCVIGDGRLGSALVAHPLHDGVVFTGSFSTAKRIEQALNERQAPITPFIAETGGINTMIVDSSSLIEQVVKDVIISSFLSAGQRCSALRVLCVHEEIYTKTTEMLKGAVEKLVIGLPHEFPTDIGPVIDEEAYQTIHNYIQEKRQTWPVIAEASLNPELNGNYIAPIAFAITRFEEVKREVFGPVLHILKFSEDSLPKVLADIRQSRYGLTMGIHSRIDTFHQELFAQAHIGNVYVNRSTIGAVVGVQPFGGEGYSGTGPKAGGPHYLYRFLTERTLTINTTAAGGNASLLMV